MNDLYFEDFIANWDDPFKPNFITLIEAYPETLYAKNSYEWGAVIEYTGIRPYTRTTWISEW